MVEQISRLKSKLANKQVTIGSWITLGHLSIAEIMADAGFDWLCVDLEHSVINYYEAEVLIASIQSKGLFSYVRVGENNPTIIKRVLDAGADGVIVPMVNSGDDAVRAVQAVKYPPIGKRGVGLARAQAYGFGFDQYAGSVNKKTRIIAQIEHIDAINNLEDILSVQGIDGTIIGPYDLSGSLGKPGKYDDEKVKQALLKYERIGLKHKKPIGFHVIEPDHKLVLEKIHKGYTFLAFSLDTMFLGSMCGDQLNLLRNKIK